MRLLNALKADVLFQFKQGFYLVYILLTIIYVVILSKVPFEWKSTVLPLVLFSDPSMVGFFFIGALVMLEKVQGVLQYVVATPLRSLEYLMAKALSLTILAVVVTVMITISTYDQPLNWLLLITGVALSSFFFVLYGFLVAVRCTTLNQYFIKMVPYMLLIVLPCFSLIEFPYYQLFYIFPSVAGIRLVYGAFNGLEANAVIGFTVYLLIANYAQLYFVEKIFDRLATGGK